MSTELEPAGWRRMANELYAAVRAEKDPQRTHALWRRGRDELFRSHPQSPLPPGDPPREIGPAVMAIWSGLRFELPWPAAEEELSLSMPTTDGSVPMHPWAAFTCCRSLAAT
jgi:hypothetical protein